MLEWLQGLTKREAGALALAVAAFVVPLLVALLFVALGALGRAWHWMLAGF